MQRCLKQSAGLLEQPFRFRRKHYNALRRQRDDCSCCSNVVMYHKCNIVLQGRVNNLVAGDYRWPLSCTPHLHVMLLQELSGLEARAFARFVCIGTHGSKAAIAGRKLV